MPTSYTLGAHFETFVKRQLASGRYNNASEVVRDGLRMLEDKERRLAVLDATLERRWAETAEGKPGVPADEVFDRLEAKYALLAEGRDPR